MMKMDNCLICEIRKAAHIEFMDFLNWLTTKPYYEQIQGEYFEYKTKSSGEVVKE